MGLIFFLVAHILYSVLFLQYYIPGESAIVLAPLYLIYLLYSIILFGRYKLKGMIAAGVIVYILGISFMSFTCLLILISRPQLPGILLFAGSLFFLVSDSVLGYCYFVRIHAQSHRIVMGSYICAQLLIITGCILLPV